MPSLEPQANWQSQVSKVFWKAKRTGADVPFLMFIKVSLKSVLLVLRTELCNYGGLYHTLACNNGVHYGYPVVRLTGPVAIL